MEDPHRPFQAHEETKSWFSSLTDHLGEASASDTYVSERPSVRGKAPNLPLDPTGHRLPNARDLVPTARGSVGS